jgi:hypothetical protein
LGEVLDLPDLVVPGTEKAKRLQEALKAFGERRRLAKAAQTQEAQEQERERRERR